MSELRHDEIIYEEGWRTASQPEVSPEADIPADELPQGGAHDSDNANTEKDGSLPMLITIQLFLCIAAAVFLFIMKAMDSEIYTRFMTYYRVGMNKPVISRELFDSLGSADLDVSTAETQDGEAETQSGTDDTEHR